MTAGLIWNTVAKLILGDFLSNVHFGFDLVWFRDQNVLLSTPLKTYGILPPDSKDVQLIKQQSGNKLQIPKVVSSESQNKDINDSLIQWKSIGLGGPAHGKVTICCTQSPAMVVGVCGVLWGILGPGVWVFEINNVRSMKFVASIKTRRSLKKKTLFKLSKLSQMKG